MWERPWPGPNLRPMLWRGIFLTLAWNSLPRGVELRTWGVLLEPPNQLNSTRGPFVDYGLIRGICWLFVGTHTFVSFFLPRTSVSLLLLFNVLSSIVFVFSTPVLLSWPNHNSLPGINRPITYYYNLPVKWIEMRWILYHVTMVAFACKTRLGWNLSLHHVIFVIALTFF